MNPQQWPKRTDQFVAVDRVPVAVGIVPTILFTAVNLRGYTSAVVFIDNDGVDQFDGQLEFSPNGTYPGTIEPNDAFAAMAPGGPTRWVRVAGDAQWLRVSGQFSATPGNIRVSVILQRGT